MSLSSFTSRWDTDNNDIVSYLLVHYICRRISKKLLLTFECKRMQARGKVLPPQEAAKESRMVKCGVRLPLRGKHTLITPPFFHPRRQDFFSSEVQNKSLMYALRRYKHGWMERYLYQMMNKSNKISFFYISESLF